MIEAGPHGGDGAALARALGVAPADVLDLSMNLNPLAPDVVALARDLAWTVGHYPDGTVAHARLAEAMDVDPARLLLTNGGSEAIALVAAEVGGGVLAEPDFALHPRSAEGPRWRSEPHSPSGLLARDDPAVDPAAVTVWDEAYLPLATGRWTAGRPGVAVGSLTKLWACPGLRLGYVLVDDAPGAVDLLGRIAAHQPGWPISSLALACVGPLLDRTDLPAWSAGIAELRARLVALLARHGLVARAGSAPWVLVAAPGLRADLAPAAINVRDCTSFGLPGHVRLAVPDAHGLARLDRALASIDPPTALSRPEVAP